MEINRDMFHLLVFYQGWPDTDGTLSKSRLYIRGSDLVGSVFYSNGQLDVAKLKEYLALLVTETGGNGPQLARMVHISKMTLVAIREAKNKAWVLRSNRFKLHIQKQMNRLVESVGQGGNRKSDAYQYSNQRA